MSSLQKEIRTVSKNRLWGTVFPFKYQTPRLSVSVRLCGEDLSRTNKVKAISVVGATATALCFVVVGPKPGAP